MRVLVRTYVGPMSVHMGPAVRPAQAHPIRCEALGSLRDQSLEEPAMSTTPFVSPRAMRRVPVLALVAAASGLLAPLSGGATAQAGPVTSPTAALLDRPARLRVENVSLADALGELERRSGVPLAYSPSLLPRDRSLRCACDGATIAEALGQLLAAVPFTYREADGQVIVVPAARTNGHDADAGSPPESLPMPAPEVGGALGIVMPASTPVTFDSATVTGRVANEVGTPVSNATVTIPSLRLSATTNDAGVYRIFVAADRFVARSDTLRVTRLGY